MLPPKRFKENLTKATVIKRNGTESMGIDQDGIAKSIDIETLLKIENIENGARADAVDALAKGGPAGTYATLAELQSDNPNHERIYVVTADGNWYFWGGSAWESGGVYNDSAAFSDLAGADRTTQTVKGNADALETIEERLTGLDTLVYEGKTYMVSKRIENGHLVTTYTEVI